MKKEETEKKEEEPAKQEKEAKEEKEVAKEEAKKEKPAKEKKTEKKAEEAKGSKKQKTMQCKVTLLDDTQFECELDVRARYSVFSCVCATAMRTFNMVMKAKEHLSSFLSISFSVFFI